MPSLSRNAAMLFDVDAPRGSNYAYVGMGVCCEAECAMPQARRFAWMKPPIGVRRCPSCGLPMSLCAVEPSEKPDNDQRTFECPSCAYAETATIKFR